MSENLKGKVAVITGGGGVLCSEFARGLGRLGVKVAILNRTQSKADAVVNDIIQAGGTAIGISCDVLDKASIEKAAAMVNEKFGICDILINGAGGNHPSGTTTKETTRNGRFAEEGRIG